VLEVTTDIEEALVKG